MMNSAACKGLDTVSLVLCWISRTRISSDLGENQLNPPHLPQEEHKVSDSIDCGDAQSIFHQDHKGVACRRAETGAVDGCGCICILGNKNPGETVESVIFKTRGVGCFLPD